MKHSYLLIYLAFLAPLLPAQPSQILSETYQSRIFGTIDTMWQNEMMAENVYNEQGDRIFSLRKKWDGKLNNWKVNQTVNHTYYSEDNAHQTVTSEWNDYPLNVQMIWSQYRKSDEKGRLLLFRWKTENKRENYTESSSTRFVYGDHSYPIVQVNFNWDSRSNTYIPYDSIIKMYDPYQKLILSNKYIWNADKSEYDLQSEYQIKYTRDDRGNIVKEIREERNSKGLLVDGQTIESVFDEDGRTLFIQHTLSNNNKSRSSFKYDQWGNQIHRRVEANDNGGQWVLEYEYNAEYKASDQIAYQVHQYEWDTDKEEWKGYYEVNHFYDSENRLSEIHSHNVVKDTKLAGSLFPYDYVAVEKLSYRCDGELLSRVRTLTEGVYPGEYREGREKFTYNWSPLCDMPVPGELDLKIYPNPSPGIIHLESTVFLQENTTIRVYNQTGQKVFQKNAGLGSFQVLDLSTWEPGIYNVEVAGGGKKVYQQFIRQ